MAAERIEEFIAETRHLQGADAFVAEHPYPFLIREQTRGAVPVREDRATARLAKASAPVGDGFGGGEVLIYRVCPADPGRNEGAVRLGREAGNDVQIEDGSVSSEHARFTLEVDDEGKPAFFVTDAGSSNGTWLNGEKLPDETPTPLSDQDSLRFGPAVKLQFFTAEGFYVFLDFYRRIKK